MTVVTTITPPDVRAPGRSLHREFSPRAAAAEVPFEVRLMQDLADPYLDRQFEQLMESVVRELPPEAGGSLLLAGVGSSSHVADVAAHLARRLAACGYRSLLVDADSQQRVLTQRFAATGEQGLMETLSEGVPSSRYALATSVPQLAFLPFGQGRLARRAAAAEVVRATIAWWRQHYGYVVVASGTEASASLGALARHCDATYLVVQLGTADRVQTARAANALIGAGARLLGSVATSVPRTSAGAR